MEHALKHDSINLEKKPTTTNGEIFFYVDDY